MLRRLTFKGKVTKIVLVISLNYTHQSHEALTHVLDLLKVCSNNAPFNCSEQESEHNLQLMILTYP